ncbi:30S ribosomal protein S19 [Candidatus Gugararchaeum adminiculabundum]|nr:30S ribosomal protein S19 [Candidatus Gugararchaeum adminiculabundum]
MAREETTFKGKSKEELLSMPLDQALKLLNSRSRRAVKRTSKQNYRFKDLMKHVAQIRKAGQKKPIRTQVRDAVIMPDWLGMQFAVHNGKDYKLVDITVEKIGYRLGDFAHTTGRVLHSGPGVGATRSSKFIPLK